MQIFSVYWIYDALVFNLNLSPRGTVPSWRLIFPTLTDPHNYHLLGAARAMCIVREQPWSEGTAADAAPGAKARSEEEQCRHECRRCRRVGWKLECVLTIIRPQKPETGHSYLPACENLKITLSNKRNTAGVQYCGGGKAPRGARESGNR